MPKAKGAVGMGAAMSRVKGVGAWEFSNIGSVDGVAAVGAFGVSAAQAVAFSAPEDADEQPSIGVASGLATLLWWSPMTDIELPAVGAPIGSTPLAGGEV